MPLPFSSRRLPLAGLSILAFAAVGCPAPQVAATGTIRFAVRPGFSAQAAPAPKTAADIATYTVTLYGNTNTQVPAAGSLVNPLTLTAPTTTGGFTGVPDGTGYYVKVNALDAGNASVVQGGAQASTNTVTLAGGVPTYSAGTALTVNLTLQSNAGTLSTAGTITYYGSSTTPPVPGGDTYTLSLFNWQTREISHGAMSTDPRFRLSQVRASSQVNGWGPYSIVPTVINATTKQASLPFGQNFYDLAAMATGNDTSQLSTYALTNINTAGGSVTMQWGPVTDAAGNLFYFDGTNIRRQAKAVTGANTLILANPGPIKGMAVDGNTDLYYSTGTDIQKATQASAYATITTVRTAANVGTLTADIDFNLYWQETGTNKLYRSTLAGGVYGTPAVLATAAGPVLQLGTDFAGGLYYAIGNTISKVPMRSDGTYGVPVTVVTAAAPVTSFSVDNVGDVIFTDGSDYIKMVLADRVPATVYTVAGTGNTLGGGVINFLPTASPYTTNGIAAPNGVRYDGAMLYFTSAGDGGVGRYFHSIKAQ